MESETLDFYIYPRESDATKRISMQNIGSYLIDAAGIVAKAQGFGMEVMHKQGLAWVISRMAIEMNEYPREYHSIKIETWVEDCNPIFSTRNFMIYGEEGEILGQASTLWSMIDFKTRKMVDLVENTNMAEFVVTGKNEKFSMKKPKRVDFVEEYEIAGTHKVAYSDIDTNRHVNSMKYLQWVIDTIDMKDLLENKIKRVDINFIKEALYGQKIEIHSKKETLEGEEKARRFDVKNENGISCCKIRIYGI